MLLKMFIGTLRVLALVTIENALIDDSLQELDLLDL